jgi:hypothetical protein
MRWAGHVARLREKRNAYRLLVGKAEGKKPLGRPRHGWVNNIKMDLVEVGWGDVDWLGLAQDRKRWEALEDAVMHLRAPLTAGKLSSAFENSFSLVQCCQASFLLLAYSLHGITLYSELEPFCELSLSLSLSPKKLPPPLKHHPNKCACVLRFIILYCYLFYFIFFVTLSLAIRITQIL